MLHYPHDVTAIILAGGLGRRLNWRNKGLISLSGKTFVEHIITRLKSQTRNIIINANQDINIYRNTNLPVIQDNFAGNQGPLAGILSCRNQINTQLILTVPCDAPLLPINLLNTMLECYNKNTPTMLCVAHDGNRLQNLFMLFDKKQLDQLDIFFQQNNRKVGDWIQSQAYTKVDFSEQEAEFINVNTEKTLNSLQMQSLLKLKSNDIE